MKNGIKTLAMWLIIGVIFIVVLSSILENSNSKLKYSELVAQINEGKVESIGTYDELSKNSKVFKEFIESQKREVLS